jgi:hypothetical protein
MDNRTINEHYAEIGMELIQTEESLLDIKNSDITIVYLSSDAKKMEKGNAVLGQCEKIADKYKWGMPCDMTITIFEPNIVGFTEEQIKILIFHELLHVGIGCNKDNSESYFVKPHDLEDFKEIINRFGTDWNEVRF